MCNIWTSFPIPEMTLSCERNNKKLFSAIYMRIIFAFKICRMCWRTVVSLNLLSKRTLWATCWTHFDCIIVNRCFRLNVSSMKRFADLIWSSELSAPLRVYTFVPSCLSLRWTPGLSDGPCNWWLKERNKRRRLKEPEKKAVPTAATRTLLMRKWL